MTRSKSASSSDATATKPYKKKGVVINGPDLWKGYDLTTERSPKTPVVVLPCQLGAFAGSMRKAAEFHISTPICTHVLPESNYAAGEWIMHTNKMTKKVLHHLEMYHDRPLLESLTLQYTTHNRKLNRPVCAILKNIGRIESNIIQNLKTHVGIHATNAAIVRATIHDALTGKFTGDESYKKSLASCIRDRYNSCIIAQAQTLSRLPISHDSVIAEPWHTSLIHDFIEKNIKKPLDTTDRETLSTLRVSQETTAINTAVMCMAELAAVYEDIRANLENNPWEVTEVKLLGVLKSKKDEPIDLAFWWGDDDSKTGSAAPAKEGVTPTPTKPAESAAVEGGGNEADSVNQEAARFRSDLKVGEECLGMFLWDLITERLELLWSNVESFLNIFLSGNRTSAHTMTESLMEILIPVCLSPLFRTPPASSAVILANKSSLADQTMSDGQKSIQEYYSVLYTQLNAPRGTQSATFVGKFFMGLYKPHPYTDDNEFRRPLTNAATSFVDAVMANGITPNINYQGANYEKLVGAGIDLKNSFEQIAKMKLDNMSRIVTYMTASVLKERDNEMAQWIRSALMPATLAEANIYEVVRKIIMSVYSNNLVFHYLFRTSQVARQEIANHMLDYAAVFCSVHSDPLSTGLDPAIMKRAEKVFHGLNSPPEETVQASSVETGQASSVETGQPQSQKKIITAAEIQTASYRPKQVLYVKKYTESLADGKHAEFDRKRFRNPKSQAGENDRKAVKTLELKKVADFRPPVNRKRQPKPKEAASRPESAVSTASKGGGKGDAGKKGEAGGKADDWAPMTAKEIRKRVIAGKPIARKSRKPVTRQM